MEDRSWLRFAFKVLWGFILTLVFLFLLIRLPIFFFILAIASLLYLIFKRSNMNRGTEASAFVSRSRSFIESVIQKLKLFNWQYLSGVILLTSMGLSLLIYSLYQWNLSRHSELKLKEDASELFAYVLDYKSSKGRYPDDVSLFIKSSPLRENRQIDPWGTPYRYKVSEDLQSFSILSAGKDARFGTQDDLVLKP